MAEFAGPRLEGIGLLRRAPATGPEAGVEDLRPNSFV